MPQADEFATDVTFAPQGYNPGSATEVAPLPPGVHPNDPSELLGPNFGGHGPAPQDTPGNRYTTGLPPWKVENSAATPVFQRASHDWTVKIIKVDSNNGGTAVACGRQKGRQSVTLLVPTLLPDGTTPAGVVYAPTEDEVQAGSNAGGILNPGDSVSIATEGPVYVGVIGAATSGAVQVTIESTPPGGALGGM